MQRFPYLVFYRDLPDRTEVVAVAHGAREPGYWLNANSTVRLRGSVSARVERMPAKIEEAIEGAIADAELEALLEDVYVSAGFTDPEVARTVFAASEVRARGVLLVARDEESGALLGTVIMVPPNAPGRKLAEPDEAEMHLLAVARAARGRGIGGTLIDACIERARRAGFSRMVLWTQPPMREAQRLYERAGFARVPARDFTVAGRQFLVYERAS